MWAKPSPSPGPLKSMDFRKFQAPTGAEPPPPLERTKMLSPSLNHLHDYVPDGHLCDIYVDRNRRVILNDLFSFFMKEVNRGKR